MHHNHQAFWRQLARVTDGAVVEVPGGLVVETGIPAAGFNQLHGGADAAGIASAAEHFRDRGLPWRIFSEGPDAAAVEFAARHGVAREPLYPILRLPAADATPPGPRPGPLTVSTAGDLADLRAFVDCAAAGYRMDPALLKPLVHKRALADDDLRIYLGRLDGRCVAVSVGVRCGDTVGVYFVAVRRGFRRRGFGAAITWPAVRDGFGHGASLAVLQATSAGYPLYVGMGFTQVADYYLWDLPARPAKAARA